MLALAKSDLIQMYVIGMTLLAEKNVLRPYCSLIWACQQIEAKYLESLIVLILNCNSFNVYYAFDTLTVADPCLQTK